MGFGPRNDRGSGVQNIDTTERGQMTSMGAGVTVHQTLSQFVPIQLRRELKPRDGTDCPE